MKIDSIRRHKPPDPVSTKPGQAQEPLVTGTNRGSRDFVIDNLTAEIDQFDTVIAAMRTQLQSLDPTERARVEDASAVLRKTRAAQGRTLLPLTIINSSD